MNASDLLDYRPELTLKREISAPLPDAEVYENPDKALSTPLATLYRSRPSVVLEDVAYVRQSVEDKIDDLTRDKAVVQYMDASPSLARQILYSSIENMEGSTNVILYDRLTRLRDEMLDKTRLIMESYFGKDMSLEDVRKEEQTLIDLFISLENTGKSAEINYQTLCQDLKAFTLMHRYFYDLINAVDNMMVSNEPLETNIMKMDKALLPLYDLQHDRTIRDILEGKNVMDINLRNDDIGNKLRRLYNLRTRLITISAGFTEEQRKEHKERIREAEAEISGQITDAEKNLHKSIQAQRLSLEKFNQGFRNKCEIIHNLKGGNRI